MPELIVADTSFLVRLDRKKKLHVLEKYARKNDVKIHISPHVKKELIDEPRREGVYPDSVTRFKNIIGNGVILVTQVDFSDTEISTICDNVRRRIAQNSGKKEHEVERADVEIIGLTRQLSKTGDRVRVIFRDKAMKEAFESVIRGRHLPLIVLVDSEEFIEQLGR